MLEYLLFLRPLFDQYVFILQRRLFNKHEFQIYILHFLSPYAILTLLISAVFLPLYLHRIYASHFRPVPYRNIYPTMNVTIDRMTESLITKEAGGKEVLCMADDPPVF